MTEITVTNPWTGKTFNLDITGLSQEKLDAYALLMDDELRESIHDELAPCEPEQFLAAWAEKVGSEEAGRVILGS